MVLGVSGVFYSIAKTVDDDNYQNVCALQFTHLQMSITRLLFAPLVLISPFSLLICTDEESEVQRRPQTRVFVRRPLVQNKVART